MATLLVIAHRGASGERPEHTRAAFDLAIDQGADFIEPDLVMSADGALIVRHENEIADTTDIAAHPEFADRHTTRSVDGQSVTGWFTEDFTLAELRTLKTRERLPALRPGNTAFDGTQPILTFQQVIDIARAGSARTGRTIGVCPELKHPTYFEGRGLPMLPPFLATLAENDLTAAESPVLIQCFEPGTLRALRSKIGVPLLQLIAATGRPVGRPDLDAATMVSRAGLQSIATYADAIGVDTALIVPRDDAGTALPPTSLVANAHAAGLTVFAWTFRAENLFLPLGDRRGDPTRSDYPAAHGDLAAQIRSFQTLGIDGVFSDFPDLAVAARGGL